MIKTLYRGGLVFLFLTAFFFIGGCNGNGPEYRPLSALDNPLPEDLSWCDEVVPKAVVWSAQQEKALASQGRALSPDELKTATQIGLRHSEKVRVVTVASLPMPEDSFLAGELKKLGFGATTAGGLTLGYVIMIHPKYEGEKWLIVHELVHVKQREQLGAEAFLRKYLLELRVVSYEKSSLEAKANKIMDEIN